MSKLFIVLLIFGGKFFCMFVKIYVEDKYIEKYNRTCKIKLDLPLLLMIIDEETQSWRLQDQAKY